MEEFFHRHGTLLLSVVLFVLLVEAMWLRTIAAKIVDAEKTYASNEGVPHVAELRGLLRQYDVVAAFPEKKTLVLTSTDASRLLYLHLQNELVNTLIFPGMPALLVKSVKMVAAPKKEDVRIAIAFEPVANRVPLVSFVPPSSSSSSSSSPEAKMVNVAALFYDDDKTKTTPL